MPTYTKELGRIWASKPESVSRDPGIDKYSLGFIAEIPTYQVLNYLHQRIDQNILALAERGVFAWGTDVTYALNAKVWDDLNGKIYQAKVASPSKTLPPSQNSDQWAESLMQLTRAEFTKLQTDLTNHTGNFANPHKLTAAQLDTYTKAQIDAMAASVQGDIDDHVLDMNNPHQDTAANIGAVPITGGAYTGGVTHSLGEVIIGALGADTKVRTEDGRVFLKKGTIEMGIDSAGKAYVKDGSGTAFLLDEDLFLELKSIEEKNYATPLPSTEFKFHTDLHAYSGVGPAQFTSTGGKTFVDRSGATITAAVDQPRITQYGMAFRDTTETLEVIRTYDGVGWSEGTMEIDFYIPEISGNNQYLMRDDGFLFAKLRVTGAVMDFYWTNSVGVETIVNLTNNLTVGRHRFVMTSDSSGSISFYLDGQLVKTTVVALPSRTGWTKTNLMWMSSGTMPRDNYLVGFRLWSVVLTAKQVAGL